MLGLPIKQNLCHFSMSLDVQHFLQFVPTIQLIPYPAFVPFPFSLNPSKSHFFISRHIIVDVGVLTAFYSKSPTLCSIFLGHFAASTPTSDQSDILLESAVRTVCNAFLPPHKRLEYGMSYNFIILYPELCRSCYATLHLC